MVYVNWGHLPDQDVRLLAYMANRALDAATPERPARTYFGGRDHLAIGLGRDPSSRDPKALKATREAVRRVVQRLVTAGAIERTTRAREGRRQVYLLNLDRPTPRVALEGHLTCGPETHTSRGPETHTPYGSRATRRVAPRSTEEPIEDLTQEPGGSGRRQPEGFARDAGSSTAAEVIRRSSGDSQAAEVAG